MGTGAGNGISAFEHHCHRHRCAWPTRTYGIAMGANTVVQMAGGVAIGTDSCGNGRDSTLDNQFVLGTENHTYTTPGITSALSRRRQTRARSSW